MSTVEEGHAWTSAVITFIDIQDSVMSGRHMGSRRNVDMFVPVFAACVEEAHQRVLRAKLPSSILPKTVRRARRPDEEQARASGDREMLSPAYYLRVNGDECLLIITDFVNLHFDPRHELWDPTDPLQVSRMPPARRRSRLYERAVGLSVERAMRFGRLVKLLWAVSPFNASALLARDKPGPLAMGVHFGPVAWSEDLAQRMRAVHEEHKAYWRLTRKGAAGDDGQFHVGAPELERTLRERGQLPGYPISINRFIKEHADAPWESVVKNSTKPEGISISYAKRVEAASRARSFIDAAVSSPAYAAFRRTEISGAHFESFRADDLRGLRDNQVLWTPMGVRPLPNMDALQIMDVYAVWRAAQWDGQALEPFWGPIVAERLERSRAQGLEGNDDWKGYVLDPTDPRYFDPADYHRKFVWEVADGGNIRNWLAIELATQALAHGSPRRGLALLELTELVGREVSATGLMIDLLMHSSITAASKLEASHYVPDQDTYRAERRRLRYASDREAMQARAAALLSVLDAASQWRDAYAGGVRTDTKILFYINALFGLETAAAAGKRAGDANPTWPPVSRRVDEDVASGAGRDLLREAIAQLGREAAQGYAHGRAWFWLVLLHVADVLFRQRGRAPTDGGPAGRRMLDPASGQWLLERGGDRLSKELLWQEFSDALRTVEESVGTPLEVAVREVDTMFMRVYHPSARLFHLATWRFIFGGPFGVALFRASKLDGLAEREVIASICAKLEDEWSDLYRSLSTIPDRHRRLGVEWEDWYKRVAPWALMPHPTLFGLPLKAELHGPFYPYSYEGNPAHARCWVAPIQMLPLEQANKVFWSVCRQSAR